MTRSFNVGQPVIAPCRISGRDVLKIGQIMDRHTGVAGCGDNGDWVVPRRPAPTVDRYGYVYVRFGYGPDQTVCIAHVSEVEPAVEAAPTNEGSAT